MIFRLLGSVVSEKFNLVLKVENCFVSINDLFVPIRDGITLIVYRFALINDVFVSIIDGITLMGYCFALIDDLSVFSFQVVMMYFDFRSQYLSDSKSFAFMFSFDRFPKSTMPPASYTFL